MSNLTQRIITAVIGASLVIAAILYHEATFLALLILISTLGTLEFYKLAKNDGVMPQVIPGVLMAVIPLATPLLAASTGISLNLLPLLIALPYIVFIRELYTASSKPFTNIGYTFLGVLYIALPIFLFYLYSFQGNDPDHYHPQNILGFLFILWASDTGAYFAGRFLGKHKLFERLSPKKTWEGFFGGLLLALTVAWIISMYYTQFSRSTWLAIGLIIVITGALGDLVESMFKRSIAIKDSGHLLPGHGGILDRFDGLFISAPFVFVYLLLLG